MRRSIRSSRSASSCREPKATRKSRCRSPREEGVAGVAARRRHLAMRPDRRRRARDRQQQASERDRSRSMPMRATACVQPGVVLDQLNARAQDRTGSGIPVDVSTSRAGDARRHGRQQQLRLALDPLRQHGAQRARDRGVAADGARMSASATCRSDPARCDAPPGYRRARQEDPRDRRARSATRSSARCPKVLRRVGGYNLDMVSGAGHNMAHLLVGSEGTLALLRSGCSSSSRRCRSIKCSASCHFPTFYHAMDAPQHIVKLSPAAVELVDRTMIELARANPAFRPDRRAIRERRARRDPAGRVRRRRPGRASRASCNSSSS